MAKITKKSKKEESVVSCGVARVFKYNAGVEAVVDGNSVQMAFLREYKGEPQTAMKYVWYTRENGELIKRGLYVSGHGQYGVPTLKEYDVYLALQRLFISKKTKNGVCELRTQNVTDEYLTIDYNITELTRELGYKTPSNATRKNIEKSLVILLSTTFFSIYAGGIYDIRKKKYITNKKKSGMHLLESIDIYETKEEDIEDDNEYIDMSEFESNTRCYDITRIRLSRFTYEQILNNYKLFYNKEKYFKTKNLVARKIYNMALQWKGNNNYSYANISTLIERIPMVNVDDKYKKRDIKKALKILNDKDIVKIKYDDENPDKVYFLFNEEPQTEQEICVDSLDKYNSFSEIKNKYFELGFRLDEIDKYLDVENIRYIQALLRYMDERMKNNSIKNPKAYFKRCISNPLKCLKQYYYNEER